MLWQSVRVTLVIYYEVLWYAWRLNQTLLFEAAFSTREKLIMFDWNLSTHHSTHTRIDINIYFNVWLYVYDIVDTYVQAGEKYTR